MAKTRAQSKSLSGSEETLTSAEADILRQSLAEKERRLNEQAESIRQQQIELASASEMAEKAREKQTEIERDDIRHILEAMRHEMASQIRVISDRMDNIQTRNYNEDPYYLPSQQYVPVPPVPENPPPPSEKTPFRLKEITDSIPKYDGQRMSIFQFCKICKRALSLIPANQEKYLIQIIISKLTGHAYTVIEDGHYPNLASLLKRLKSIFGPNKSLNQYRGELGNAYMRHNESIFDYIARIKELRMAIMDCELEDDKFSCSVDHDVLESFINGLPSDLLIRVKLEGCYGLDDAFTKAIQISKTLEVEAARRKSSFPVRPPPLPRRDYPVSGSPSEDRSNVSQPTILKRPPPQVPFYKSGPLIKPLIPGQPGPNAPTSTESACYYCKTPGHFMSQCKKLAYRKQMYGPSTSAAEAPIQEQAKDSGNAISAPVISGVRRDESTMRRPTRSVQFSSDVEKIPPCEASRK